MSIAQVTVDGVEFEIAPMEPPHWDKPSPGFLLAVTPEVARSWLKYNWRNRNPRKKGLSDYTADISEGRFDLNGSTITFSRPLKEGEDKDIPAGSPVLIDGQHRLKSCAESGKPFVTYVIYGLAPEARRTVDSGLKRRFQDNLQMDGVINAPVVAAVTARCVAWTIGDRHLTMKRDGMSKTALAQFIDEHPEIHRSAHIACRVHDEFVGSAIRQSVVGVAHWLFMQADASYAPEFFARLGDGAEMPKDHPIMLLRRRIMKDKTDRDAATRLSGYRVPDWRILCYMIRTWNAVQTDQTTFTMVGRSDHLKIPLIRTAGDQSAQENPILSELEEPVGQGETS